MSCQLVFRIADVAGFSPAGAEGMWVSRLLIDKESVGSNQLVVNHFLLKSGKSTQPGRHPNPYDEVYYVLKGRGLLQLGEQEPFELEPDTIAFIPAGTLHALSSSGGMDLELLTIMPQQLVAGVNPIYDERLQSWGTSFRLAKQT